MSEIIDLILELSQSFGYLGIIILMSIESSFIPFPSEMVIPPAAYLASLGEMNIFLVILCGILGSLIGATVNYVLALTLGRKIIYALADTKFARVLLISKDKIKKTERYFLHYGKASTFLGRFIPAIRQLISIPAGFAKMNYVSFIFYTFLGSGIWVIILAILGYSFGANQELLSKYYKEISVLFIFITVIFILWLSIKQKSEKK